ncbi:MAG: hypothetical protein GEU80_04220 [Dehalococcoidia bacterium]|nr:hypothetical protein [Dehalococcoidia bacterium]
MSEPQPAEQPAPHAARPRMRAAVIAALASLAFVVALGSPGTARANGVPTLVDLAYIDLSNWGPEGATGVAELIFAEGVVRVDAEGLPALETDRYQGWLVNSEVGDAISAGRFNANAEGVVDFQGSLPPIADFGFDLFIITVEAEPDEAPQPSGNRSIGGYFELIGEPGVDGNQSPVSQPAQLPDTGEAPLARQDLLRAGALLAVMALSVFVAVRLGRRTA